MGACTVVFTTAFASMDLWKRICEFLSKIILRLRFRRDIRSPGVVEDGALEMAGPSGLRVGRCAACPVGAVPAPEWGENAGLGLKNRVFWDLYLKLP